MKAIRDQYGDLVRQRYPNIPRRVSGYNLNYLLPENGFHVARALVGSEGTCVTTLEATCRLVESPPERVLLVIGCRDVYECADLVPEVLSHRPIGLEGMDDLLIEYTRRKGINPEGLALLPGWRGMAAGGVRRADCARSGIAGARIDGGAWPMRRIRRAFGCSPTSVRQGKPGKSGNPRWARFLALPGSRRRGKGGRTRRSLPKNSVDTCASSES